MLRPASKNSATGGPFGSYGKAAVVGSSETPPRPAPPAGGPPPVGGGSGTAPPAAAAPCAAGAWPPCRPASPCRPPAPPPRGGPLCARIHMPEKSGLPSAVRGAGASYRICPFASRGTAGDSGTFPHCAATVTEPAITRQNTSCFTATSKVDPIVRPPSGGRCGNSGHNTTLCSTRPLLSGSTGTPTPADGV